MQARDLEVYKRAFKDAVDLHKITTTDTWPKHELYGGLSDQIRRATRSICANMAEGMGKQGPAEQKRFLNMAIGSSDEVLVWLDFALALGYIEKPIHSRLFNDYAEISKILYSLMRRRTGRTSS